MRREAIRACADTSVYGGAFDPPFAAASQAFFAQARGGRFQLVTSPLLQTELDGAPDQVRALFDDVLRLAEHLALTKEALDLQRAYITQGIVGPRQGADALHVALASVAERSLPVSWNPRHIVQFAKIRLYNAVNALHGYAPIAIYSPPEVTGDDDD